MKVRLTDQSTLGVNQGNVRIRSNNHRLQSMVKVETLKKNAKALRNNMTREEKRLWYDLLKDLPFTVNRQRIIGAYIVDFYIAEKKTVIEVDGRQHEALEGLEKDEKRDRFLKEKGITVLRYSNLAIDRHFNEVCRSVCESLGVDYEEFVRKCSEEKG